MVTRGDGAGGVDRFAVPLYTVAEAARYLDVPDSTLRSWAHGYRRREAGRPEVSGSPVLTALPRTQPQGLGGAAFHQELAACGVEVSPPQRAQLAPPEPGDHGEPQQ
jgi:transposase-like protein